MNFYDAQSQWIDEAHDFSFSCSSIKHLHDIRSLLDSRNIPSASFFYSDYFHFLTRLAVAFDIELGYTTAAHVALGAEDSFSKRVLGEKGHPLVT